MIVSEVMSSSVYLADPDDTLQVAAQSMADLDTGVLPVGEGDRLIGILTDRDIVVRAVAMALDAQNTRIREVMSSGVCSCFEDEPVEDVAQQMAAMQVRRLPVVNREKRLVGLVSLGDLSQSADVKVAGEALQGVSEKGVSDTTASSGQKDADRSSRTPRRPKSLDLEDGPTKYIDRPTNDGKHGDAAEETPESAPDTKTTRLPQGERARR